MLLLLRNPIRAYSWGSTTALPELLGVPPTGEPQAELWCGAHELDPSCVVPDEVSLASVIAADPSGTLGAACVEAFGPRLPFLLKVLAAAEPLSLQAHPSRAQAMAGFAEEERRGVPLDAPSRMFTDPSHKPEVICALTEFHALAGFRAFSETVQLVDSLGVPELSAVMSSGDLRDVLTRLLSPSAAELVPAVLAACARSADPLAQWAVRIGSFHPGDPGVLVTLLLNLVTLAPGEAMFVPSGVLHSYLEGVGVEVMASSDNVLRAGLTRKHVDVPALLGLLDASTGPPRLVPGRPAPNGELVYDAPVADFRLSTAVLAPGAPVVVDEPGPHLVLCVRGSARVADSRDTVTLTPGAAAFAAASGDPITLEGDATVYRASLGTIS